jgi:repressor LexA
MNKLTARQVQVLEIIRRHSVERGMPPTRAEIAAELGFRSLNAVETHIKALVRKGYLEHLPGTSRGLRICGPEIGNEADGLPLVGRVAAGSPILATEHVEDHWRIDPRLFHPQPDYLLRVHGMSMRDAGILDGDLLLVHRTPEAHSGQIVVARVDDEVTVKRLRLSGRVAWLLPENPDFEPIEIHLDRQPLSIEGLAVGVIRNGGM